MANQMQINQALADGGFVQGKGLYGGNRRPVVNANGKATAPLNAAQLAKLEADTSVFKTLGYDRTCTFRKS